MAEHDFLCLGSLGTSSVLLNLENYKKDLIYVMRKTNIPFKLVGNKIIKVPEKEGGKLQRATAANHEYHPWRMTVSYFKHGRMETEGNAGDSRQ